MVKVIKLWITFYRINQKISRGPVDLFLLNCTDIFLLKNSSCSRQSRSQVSSKGTGSPPLAKFFDLSDLK